MNDEQLAGLLINVIGVLGQVKSCRGMTQNDLEILKNQCRAYLQPKPEAAAQGERVEGKDYPPTAQDKIDEAVAHATKKIEAAAAEANGVKPENG